MTKDSIQLVRWDEEMLIPIQVPIVNDKLVFKVYDKDFNGKEIIGSMIFSKKEILEKYEGKFRWVNIYGSHTNYSGKVSDEMNSNPEIASAWKGRVLI